MVDQAPATRADICLHHEVENQDVVQVGASIISPEPFEVLSRERKLIGEKYHDNDTGNASKGVTVRRPDRDLPILAYRRQGALQNLHPIASPQG